MSLESRKFVVNSSGEARVEELSEEEKRSKEEREKRRLLTLRKDRKFVVDEKGNVKIEGDNKEKLVPES